jgi:hypothetical protein
LAIVGLIYAAGFLIVVIHLGTFGIRDLGGELWKARDIHIGVLGFVFPITIMGTVVMAVLDPIIHFAGSFKGVRDFVVRVIPFEQSKNCAAHVPSSRQSRNLAPNRAAVSDGSAKFNYDLGKLPCMGAGDRPAKVRMLELRKLANGLISMLLELAFYCFAMLHRQNAVEEPYKDLCSMLIVTLSMQLWCIPLEKVAQSLPNPRWPCKLAAQFSVLRFGVAGFIARLCWHSGAGYWKSIKEMLLMDGYRTLLPAISFFFLCVMLYLANRAYQQTQDIRLWIRMSPLLGLLYYLGLVGFAHSFFSYIPAARGGGDYTLAPRVSIELEKKKENSTSDLNKFLIIDGQRKVLIEETSTTLFVADECGEEAEGGPWAWRKNHPHRRPRVWALSRDSIVAIKYAVPDPDTPDPCPAELSKAGK